MDIYIPVHTSCSTDGSVSGSRSLGVAFRTEQEARSYLAGHPNRHTAWGEGESIDRVWLGEPQQEEGPICPRCGGAWNNESETCYGCGWSPSLETINLTQHPVSHEQVMAGVVEPADKKSIQALLTFDSPPSREDVIQRAEGLAETARGYSRAMIGGAPYLMGPLEAALKRRGVCPVYSFTKRVSRETPQPDGSTKKESVFVHEAFIVCYACSYRETVKVSWYKRMSHGQEVREHLLTCEVPTTEGRHLCQIADEGDQSRYGTVFVQVSRWSRGWIVQPWFPEYTWEDQTEPEHVGHAWLVKDGQSQGFTWFDFDSPATGGWQGYRLTTTDPQIDPRYRRGVNTPEEALEVDWFAGRR